MEINKTKCKSLSEVFSGLEEREDMRLTILLVKRALSTPVNEGEVESYTLEQVLPEDVRAMPKVVAVVQACLYKIKCENDLNAIQAGIRQVLMNAQKAAKEQISAKINERDLAVWDMKRALYLDADKLPELAPEG